jgi:hypothetical protein
MSKYMSCIVTAMVFAVPASAYAQAGGGPSGATAAPGPASSDVNSGGMSTNGIGPGGPWSLPVSLRPVEISTKSNPASASRPGPPVN